ncbi:hypothetical protein BOTBODRAFT_251580 [Botryobasidium botryosum FD-172 SS1]|uniref:F-box domain-containing protein n=1 Tax=Botryobasidium botryosum (strain FD-172 SS1) TaxID=930990 RepID=A0A067ML89_BOTB1|nr:hypothetical protein BOTBODRAFT_251580 [Botryobasidium botryosum FD-172 SS1]
MDDDTAHPPARPRELPRDVIHNIYYQCDDSNALIRFSHVCQLWRQTMHGSTVFWAKIDLDLLKRSFDSKLAYWLERAGARLLTIHMESSWEPDEFGFVDLLGSQLVQEDFESIVRLGLLLRSCMERWESLTMLTYLPVINILLPICAGHAPALKFLTIQPVDHPSGTERLLVPFLPPVNVHRHPGYSSLSVSLRYCSPQFTTFGLCITNLSLHCKEDVSNMLHTLQSCSNLITCDLDMLESDDTRVRLFNGFITMSQLATLSISRMRHIERLFDFLRLPSLQSIIFRQIDWTTAAMSAIWNVFQSSQKSLSSVVITKRGNRHADDVAPAPLHAEPLALPLVTHFEVGGNTLAHPLLEYVALPNLTLTT